MSFPDLSKQQILGYQESFRHETSLTNLHRGLAEIALAQCPLVFIRVFVIFDETMLT